MRISDWSSDVCSSDLGVRLAAGSFPCSLTSRQIPIFPYSSPTRARTGRPLPITCSRAGYRPARWCSTRTRSEEHTSELQSLMRISYAVFCLKKKNHQHLLISYTDGKRKHQTPTPTTT